MPFFDGLDFSALPKQSQLSSHKNPIKFSTIVLFRDFVCPLMNYIGLLARQSWFEYLLY